MSVLGWILAVMFYLSGAVLVAYLIYMPDGEKIGYEGEKSIKLLHLVCIIFWFTSALCAIRNSICEIIERKQIERVKKLMAEGKL